MVKNWPRVSTKQNVSSAFVFSLPVGVVFLKLVRTARPCRHWVCHGLASPLCFLMHSCRKSTGRKLPCIQNASSSSATVCCKIGYVVASDTPALAGVTAVACAGMHEAMLVNMWSDSVQKNKTHLQDQPALSKNASQGWPGLVQMLGSSVWSLGSPCHL